SFPIRYVIQLVKSEDVFPLLYSMAEDRWEVALPGLGGAPGSLSASADRLRAPFKKSCKALSLPRRGAALASFLRKEGWQEWSAPTKRKKGASGDAFVLPIRTHRRVQLQFLDRLVRHTRAPRHHQYLIQLQEPSLIAEAVVPYRFQYEQLKEVVGRKAPLTELEQWGYHQMGEPEKRRLFYALPITIAHGGKAPAKGSKGALRVVGVDVGEYGVAWVVLRGEEGAKDAEPTTLALHSMGFESSGALRKIRDRYEEIQARQQRSDFSERTTKVARVREQAITALRNKLHDVLLRHRDGKIVYEYNISAFETGSQRVVRIYDSVKRADVDLKAQGKLSPRHLWGDKVAAPLPGAQLGAAHSSYLCSHCCRGVHQKGNGATVRAVRWSSLGGKRTEQIVELDWKGDIVLGYVEGKALSPGDTLSFSEAQRAARAYARPPIVKENGATITLTDRGDEVARQLGIAADDLIRFAAARGNSSVFVCPFADCGHIADADAQAALWMALRYVVRKPTLGKKGKKSKAGAKEEKDDLEKIIASTLVLAKSHRLTVPLNVRLTGWRSDIHRF
ncbi:hypothetical protein D6792_00950, partial [Candidatus Parcubacteria bacterium]